MAKENTFEIFSKEQATGSKQAVIVTAAVVFALAGCILAHFILHPLSIPPQASLYLEYGKLIVGGRTPYVEFYDYASPLVMYVSAVPNLVAKFNPFHPIFLFNVMVWKLMMLSSILLGMLLFTTKSREQSLAPYVLTGFLLANLFFLSEFGQIHHLMIILTVPYFLARVLHVSKHKSDPRLLGVIGFLAAIGFCLDPLFLVLFFLFEAALSVEYGRLDTVCSVEFNVCIVTLVCFVIYLITQQEPMGMPYLGLPFKMMLLDYEVWNGRISYFNTTPDLRHLLYLAVLAWVLAMGLRRYCRFLVPLSLISILGFGTFVIQGKSFTYQTIPMVFTSVIILSIVFGIGLNAGLRRLNLSKNNAVCFLPVAVSLGLLCYFVYYEVDELQGVEYISLKDQGYMGEAPKSDLSLFADYIENNTNVGDRVLVINDQVVPAYPTLLQLGRKPGSAHLVCRLAKIARRVRYSRPPEVWAKTVLAEDKLWQTLKNEIDRGLIDLILVNENSMKPALDEKEVTPILLENYTPSGWVDWDRDDKKEMAIEYLGIRTSFHVYKPKK